MSDPKFHQHGGEHPAGSPPPGPRWKRIRHSPFFWVAACFIMLAMVIYITSNNLSMRPGQGAQRPVPAIAP
jgi:hypothetical protein